MGPLAGPVAVLRTIQDAYSSCLAFGLLLFRNVDIVFVTASAAAAPCLFYYYQAAGKMLQYNVSWTLVSFAVVFPLTMGVSEAFRRRETAVQQLSAFRSNLISFFTAHVDWDWNITPSSVGGSASGRTHLSPEHTQAVRESCKELLDALVEMLNADRVMSPRHYFTAAGVEKRSKVIAEMNAALQKGRAQMRHMSTLTEDFKRAGLPAPETSRLHAFFNYIQAAFEQLYCIKLFRCKRTRHPTPSVGAYVHMQSIAALETLERSTHTVAIGAVAEHHLAYVFSHASSSCSRHGAASGLNRFPTLEPTS